MARDRARKRRAAAFAPGTKLVQSRFEVPSKWAPAKNCQLADSQFLETCGVTNHGSGWWKETYGVTNYDGSWRKGVTVKQCLESGVCLAAEEARTLATRWPAPAKEGTLNSSAFSPQAGDTNSLSTAQYSPLREQRARSHLHWFYKKLARGRVFQHRMICATIAWNSWRFRQGALP